MTCHLAALCFHANDPQLLTRFWAGLLEREIAPDGLTLARVDTELPIRFQRTEDPKVGPNRIHPHLTSNSLDEQHATVARALRLGGQHLDIGQDPEDGHVVLADPEGNELCVIEPVNRFLAGCGFLGELACDGSQEVGYFWSGALGWPLVWDQGGETSIQSPQGGTKISWGGPPVAPKTGKNRLHLDLVAPTDERPEAEVERLISLGATRVDIGPGDVSRVAMADPGDNEFCLYTRR